LPRIVANCIEPLGLMDVFVSDGSREMNSSRRHQF
jgi:hypothetical protein